MECLEHGGSYDQLNLASLACVETISRRVQSIVDAYNSGSSSAPDWGAARILSGYQGPEDVVTPGLRSWAAKKGKEEVELAAARAKIREHKKLSIPTDEAAKAIADGNPPQGGGVQAILVLLTQGVLHHLQFAASLVMCPEENRKAWVPIRADEFFVYPDPSFWETLADPGRKTAHLTEKGRRSCSPEDGKIFTEEALSMLGTDFEEVRVVYSQLFNVLALKFTPHGSEHIQATEISLIQGRLEPMLNSAVPERSNSSQSSIQMLGSIGRFPGPDRRRRDDTMRAPCLSKTSGARARGARMRGVLPWLCDGFSPCWCSQRMRAPSKL
eukprot:g33154.t1